MKKTCLYILFPILILNTSFSEVFKLPRLVEHFLQHHELNNEIGVLDFISMHYFGNDLNDNDDEDDMKLPFKKISSQGHISHAIPGNKPVFLKQRYFSILIFPGSPQYFRLSNPAIGDLFRPPRA